MHYLLRTEYTASDSECVWWKKIALFHNGQFKLNVMSTKKKRWEFCVVFHYFRIGCDTIWSVRKWLGLQSAFSPSESEKTGPTVAQTWINIYENKLNRNNADYQMRKVMYWAGRYRAYVEHTNYSEIVIALVREREWQNAEKMNEHTVNVIDGV